MSVVVTFRSLGGTERYEYFSSEEEADKFIRQWGKGEPLTDISITTGTTKHLANITPA